MPFKKVNTLAQQKSQQMYVCKIEDDHLLCCYSGVSPAKEKDRVGDPKTNDGTCGCDQSNDPWGSTGIDSNKCVPMGEWDTNVTYNEKDVVKFGAY